MPVRTIAIPVSAWHPAASRVGPPAYEPPTIAEIIGTNFDEFRAEFDDTVDQTLFLKFTVPDEYVSGTRELVIWWLSADGEIVGDVRWTVQAEARADNDTWDAAFTTTSSLVDAVSGAPGQISKALIDLTAQPVWLAGEVIQLTLTRESTHFTDTMTGDSVMTIGHMLIEVIAISNTVSFTSGEALSTGSVVTIDSSSEAVLADATTATGNHIPDGISFTTYAPAVTAEIYTINGLRVPVAFSSAPAGASNGSTVYLSATAGFGTLTAPTSSGETVYILGTLTGADGVSTTPDVIFKPQFVANIL